MTQQQIKFQVMYKIIIYEFTNLIFKYDSSKKEVV